MKISIGILLIALILPFQFIIAQKKEPRLCICFKKNNQNIKVKKRKGSKYTDFLIRRPGFETKFEQKKAMEEWKNDPWPSPYGPFFSLYFYSDKNPKKITSLKELNCGQLLSVEDFRAGKVDAKKTSSLFIWIVKKVNDHSFLVWEATRYLEF